MIKELNSIIDLCEAELSANGYRGYIESNLDCAIDIALHGGSLHDLDNIVHLENIMGLKVSYELYKRIERYYDNLHFEDFEIQEDLDETDEEDLLSLIYTLLIKKLRSQQNYG